MQTMKQKNIRRCLNASREQAEQIDKKAQLYFLNSKESSDKKQRKIDDEQTIRPC